MSYILSFLLTIMSIVSCLVTSSNSFDLKIAMDALTKEELKDGSPVILKIRVMNLSKNTCPENAYKFTLFINDKLVSLDRKPTELLPQNSITYTKELGSYHFIAHKDSTYKISAKIEIAEGYEDSDLTNNRIEKLILMK
ncbi:hypothetical protein [Algoriphagus marinus]|uniref:hypothetical protein n=1 Tax=Algoriphagus marinus TaxID=1925762 RepID=UPI00094BC4FB|nr:hypothetical protein [Algoriphagus marinus]